MSEWKGPWRCTKCYAVFPQNTALHFATDESGWCDGPCEPCEDRRAPDPEKAALAEALRKCQKYLPAGYTQDHWLAVEVDKLLRSYKDTEE